MWGTGRVYLIAFACLMLQVARLVGRSGILPASEYLDAVNRSFGAEDLGSYMAPISLR